MDCMDGMKEFPDRFFDLAVVDPPYGIRVASHVNGALVGGGRGRSEALRTVYGGSRSARSRQNPTTPSPMTARRTKDISGNWRG